MPSKKPSRKPNTAGGQEDRKLGTAEAAELMGWKPATWRWYVNQEIAPPRDGKHDERTPWWWESTVLEFKATRDRLGTRPDRRTD